MNNFNENNEKSEFKRVTDYLKSVGNIHFPTDNINNWINSIEEKTHVQMIPESLMRKSFSSVDHYLEEYQKRTKNSIYNIPDTALRAIVDAISYVNMKECILDEAELAFFMITQLIRIHCVVVYSRNILVQPNQKNYELCISSNVAFKKKVFELNVIPVIQM